MNHNTSTRTAIGLGCSLLMLICTGIAINTLFLGNLSVWSELRLFIVVSLIWLTTRGNVVAVFSALCVLWIVREPVRPQLNDTIEAILSLFLSICFLAWTCRYQAIRKAVTSFLVGLAEWNENEDSANRVIVNGGLASALTWSFFLMKGLVFVLSAMFLLNRQPWTFGAEYWFRWSMANKQVLWPGPTLVVVVIGLFLVLNELSWRLKTAGQLRTFVRSEAARTLYPDVRRILQRRQRQNKA